MSTLAHLPWNQPASFADRPCVRDEHNDVTLYPGQQIDAEERLDLCREHLTKIKVPAAINIVDELLKNPVGKPDKPGLRALVSASS